MKNLSLPLLSIGLLLTGCKQAADDTAKPEAIVQAEHPTSGTITEEITGDATLAPVAQAAIVPKITAPIKKLYVQRGAHVSAGQLVAVLENSDLAAAAIDNGGAYDAAKATYNAATLSTVPEDQTRARLDLSQAKATLDLQNSILASRQQLFSQGAIPGRDLDTARTTAVQAQAAYDIAKQRFDALAKVGTTSSLETAKGQLASAKGKYLGAEAQLSYTNIRTPISGVVTDRPLFAGETAAPGAPILTIMDTSTLLAKLHLSQAQAQRLEVGSPATLTVPGLDKPVEAKVSLISPALDPGSTTVEVWLSVPNKDGRLKAGTPLHATLEGLTIPKAMLIPTDAVQRSTEAPGKFVLVIASDGTAKKRPVTVGIQTEETTQIVDGLKPDDNVIIGGGYGLDDGTKVKIGPAEAKEDDPADKKEGGK
ncbi:efflux RND transporter periplasmic adaptor subunit [Granulicella sp. WH15]|uniref:efflux RND transporter periplasmic adaptor subunit n=1 Tax=Granulicella sp. WH15 TaxID=2602070 RepID=UPI001366D7BD|nr:efflux RND transporter periplasmic adaptor subunit [Granulicella sp. WH15]QHN02874.1 efflux RND transporter periplasmic adaptor subunit [Granulicella sp. WH15]